MVMESGVLLWDAKIQKMIDFSDRIEDLRSCNMNSNSSMLFVEYSIIWDKFKLSVTNLLNCREVGIDFELRNT